MTEKRFTMSQNGNFHTVRDTVEKKPLGMFEFKENEFPVYACFHHIIDLLNEFYDENEQLKSENIQLTVDNKELKCTNNELYQENEQLKQSNQKLNDELQETMGYLALKSGVEKENEQLKKQRYDLYMDIARLVEENEQLKQTNQRLNDELQDCMGKLALKR